MDDLFDAFKALKALVDAQRQATRLMRLSFPKNDAPVGVQLIVNRLDAYEALSRDFQFTVEVLSDKPDIELKDMMGKMLTVMLVREDGSVRYFNGYVFEFRFVKNDAGFSFYDVVLLPWLAFLRLRRDNYMHHGKTVREQVEITFADYEVADWKAVNLGRDEPMTDACQFDETDHNYVSRRLEARGMHYWYEHREDGHTLMLCGDSTQGNAIDGATDEITWQGSSGIQKPGLKAFSPVRTISSNSYAASSFDFKTPRPVRSEVPSINRQGDIPSLEVYEYAGAYGFKSQEAGDDYVRLRMEELEAFGKHFSARGNEDRVQAGRTFRLRGHFDIFKPGQDIDEDNEFLILEATHAVSNNFETHESNAAEYRSSLKCIRKKIPWRPARGFNSIEPKVWGVQTAIIVCPEGQEIHTDEYGRVRVQFHWDREGTYDQRSSAFVRVATPLAGQGFGQIAIPRVGQEVIVQWLDGNPDRPVIVGSVSNADNMPPRFNHEGAYPANQALSGWSTRELGGSTHQHLLFNDTHAQTGTQLVSEHRASQLHLGHIGTGMREGQSDPRGEGVELRTLAAAVVRAAQGLLLLTEPNGDEGKQLARAELQAGITAARELARTLDAAAQASHAGALDNAPQARLVQDFEQLESGSNTAPDVPATQGGQAPVIGIGATAGIALATPKSTTIFSGEHLDVATQGNLQQTANKSWVTNVGSAISWFVAGVADQAQQVATAVSVKLIAAKGKVLVQAQSDSIDLQAERDILLGANAKVSINAKGDITLTEQGGAQIVLSGGNVTVKCTGTFTVHAGGYDFVGPQGGSVQLPFMPTSKAIKPWLGLTYLDLDTGAPIEQAPYEVTYANGIKLDGVLNASGKARREDIPDAAVVQVVYKPREPKPEQPVPPLEELL